MTTNNSEDTMDLELEDEFEIMEEKTSENIYQSVTKPEMILIINRIRKAKNISNKELSELLEKSPNYISAKFSQGSISESDMAKICYAIGIPFFVLVLLAEKKIPWPNELEELMDRGTWWVQGQILTDILEY